MDKVRIEAALMGPAPGRDLEELATEGALPPSVANSIGFGGAEEGHKDLWGHVKQVVAQTVPRRLVRWASLYHDVGKVKTFTRVDGKVMFHNHEAVSAGMWRKDAKAMGFDADEVTHVYNLIYFLGHVESYDKEWTDSAVRRVYKLTEPFFTDLLDLARADVTTKHDYKRREHHARVADLKRRAETLAALDAIPAPLPKGLGDFLCAELGLTPGRELGSIMNSMKARVEAGELPRQADFGTYLGWYRSRGQ